MERYVSQSIAVRRLRGASLSLGLPDLGSPDQPGPSIRKRVPILGDVLESCHPGILRPPFDPAMNDWQPTVLLWLTSVAPSPNSGRDQASTAGVGTGADCGAATRERGRLCRVFVDPERVVRLGLG